MYFKDVFITQEHGMAAVKGSVQPTTTPHRPPTPKPQATSAFCSPKHQSKPQLRASADLCVRAAFSQIVSVLSLVLSEERMKGGVGARWNDQGSPHPEFLNLGLICHFCFTLPLLRLPLPFARESD